MPKQYNHTNLETKKQTQQKREASAPGFSRHQLFPHNGFYDSDAPGASAHEKIIHKPRTVFPFGGLIFRSRGSCQL